MKPLITAIILLFSTNSYSQDIKNLKQIDSIVTSINYSKIKVTKDSIIQNMPDLGLHMKTYLSSLIDGKQLRKYVNYVETDRMESGTLIQMTGCNTFYFYENILIKVEEVVIADNQALQFNWYFSEDKCIYHSLPLDKVDSRDSQLLSMSKEFISKVLKNPN